MSGQHRVRVLLLFDSCLPAGRSRGGLTEQLAESVAEGVRSASHYGATAHGEVTEDDRAQARELGRRVTELAQRLFP